MSVSLTPIIQGFDVNPYGFLPNGPAPTFAPFVSVYSSLLNPIMVTLVPPSSPPVPSVQGMINAILNSLPAAYGVTLTTSTADVVSQWSAMVGNVYNAYIGPRNPVTRFYSPGQNAIIAETTRCIRNTLPITMNGFINFSNMYEEVISTSKLPSNQQVPLMMGMAILQSAFPYLYGQLSSPNSSWVQVLESLTTPFPNSSINWINFPGFLCGAYHGAMIGYTQSLTLAPPNASEQVGIARTQITVTAGAIIGTLMAAVFNFVPRPMGWE